MVDFKREIIEHRANFWIVVYGYKDVAPATRSKFELIGLFPKIEPALEIAGIYDIIADYDEVGILISSGVLSFLLEIFRDGYEESDSFPFDASIEIERNGRYCGTITDEDLKAGR